MVKQKAIYKTGKTLRRAWSPVPTSDVAKGDDEKMGRDRSQVKQWTMELPTKRQVRM